MKTGLAALAEGKHSALADALLFRALRDRLGFTPAALGRDRRRGARARHLQVLPGDGRAAAHAVRPDRNARRLHAASVRQGRSRHHGRADGRRHRDPKSTIPTSTASARSWCAIPTCSSATTRARRPPPPTCKDGWMHSGDAGYFNDNRQLVVIDRIKDLAETARGERFSPQYIENKLKFSPYIAETVVLGAGRDALAAMICIRFSIISKWAEKNRISFTTYTDLVLAPRSLCAAAQGGRDRQRHAAAGAAHLALPAALQGTRRRRRRTDPHPQGPPQRHQREIRRHHRRDLWRQARHPGRHRDPLPGRHHPAHPHHAAGGRPRPRRADGGGRGMMSACSTRAMPVDAPSPLVGEGITAVDTPRSGEGYLSHSMPREPLTRLALRIEPPSPTRGEGKHRNSLRQTA